MNEKEELGLSLFQEWQVWQYWHSI